MKDHDVIIGAILRKSLGYKQLLPGYLADDNLCFCQYLLGLVSLSRIMVTGRYQDIKLLSDVTRMGQVLITVKYTQRVRLIPRPCQQRFELLY